MRLLQGLRQQESLAVDAYPAAGVRIPSDATCAVQGLNAKCVESHPGVGTKGGVVES